MNRTLRLLSALTLVLALGAGCKKDDKAAAPAGSTTTDTTGGSAAAPATTTPPAATGGAMASMSVEQICDKSISMMQQMATAVESNKGNCDAMGDALQKWADDSKPFIEFAKAQDKDEAKKKEFEAVCTPKIEPMMAKFGPMMEGASACAENAKVKAAMSSMGG